MKKLLILLLSVCFLTVTQAQISDDEAKQLYQEAEDQFDAGNFNESYHLCSELIKKMGKGTPKTLYLEIKAIYNNLENPKNKSKYRVDKSYANYSTFVGYSEVFFSLIDKNTYPSEKYNEILQIHQYFQQGVKNYEHEKDRKPEDAISFLNECATKFKKIDKEITRTADWETSYSFHDSILQIDVFIKSKNNAARFNSVQRDRILIDLSKVWFEDRGFEKIPYSSNQRRGIYIVSTKGFRNDVKVYDSDTKKEYEIYDNITWYKAKDYRRELKYPIEEFEQQLKGNGRYDKNYLTDGYHLYHTFNELSSEFVSGNYHKRILDAFDFLISYSGGGTPREKKQEVKNKF